MKKKCVVCNKSFEGTAKKKYCSHRCKKAYENLKNTTPISRPIRKAPAGVKKAAPKIHRPAGLNETAAAYWDKVAPTVILRGHLNVLSEDAFVEICDLHSRLKDINRAINETNRSLLQIDDKWDNKAGVETQSFKESALSDLKRKYSRQFLDYCKSFYLTPLSNRGNFGIGEGEKEKDEFFN